MARGSCFLRDLLWYPRNPRARSAMHSPPKKSALSNAPTPKMYRLLGYPHRSSRGPCLFAILLHSKMAPKMAVPKWHPKHHLPPQNSTSHGPQYVRPPKTLHTHVTTPNHFHSPPPPHPRRLRPSRTTICPLLLLFRLPKNAFCAPY
jgi:hypothetical protein